ncbi:MAG: hypothetical protein GF333_06570 [Candidatus Omnitrophica bacterium]|nr:hypothetical protein [Candidatus Omnitrophota bacterium]
MNSNLDQLLQDAAGRESAEISAENPYREIGFDGGKQRLGWVRMPSSSAIRKALEDITPVIRQKKRFVFVGIGGSGNGIKTLLSLFPENSCITLDSLDPHALREVLASAENKEDLMVIAISKSGSTRETQLLALTMRELFGDAWARHFLWLSDPESFAKLDTLGWEQARRFPIQCDGRSDIGGRFSCPHTLIFLLPLCIQCGFDIERVIALTEEYRGLQERIGRAALVFAGKYRDAQEAFFCPVVSERLRGAFYPWVVQLFQESLGSKRDDFWVKTLNCFEVDPDKYFALKLDTVVEEPVVELMATMYFFQMFVAFFAAYKNINFVNQEFVEKYKRCMKELEQEVFEDVPSIDREALREALEDAVSEDPFIEVVLYFHAEPGFVRSFQEYLQTAFPEKVILLFEGSDWNHHSYQAAAGDKNTFYVFLLPPEYGHENLPFSEEILAKNVHAMKLISKATHLTLESKSLLSSLQEIR